MKAHFMTTVRGIFENGVVKLLEVPPVTGSQKVLVTFIEDTEEAGNRTVIPYQYTEEFTQYLEDPGEDIYQDYLKKKNENR